jgi:hypothetical protein
LDAGVSVAEFWALTPRETFMVLAAAGRRFEREHRRDAWIAWHTAALGRVKKLPSLQRLMPVKPARTLHGAELAKRRAEFDELKRTLGAEYGRRRAGPSTDTD